MVWLDNSRILACYAVIVLHVSVEVVLGNDIGSEYWWYGNFFDSLVRWCVPVFVMLSGALLLDENKKEDLKVFYNNRLSRIFIPILFWSAFFSCWSLLGDVMKGNEPTISGLMKKVILGKPYFHMWYLYMLVGLYLFTPLYKKIVRNTPKREMLFFVIVMFVFAALNAIDEKIFSANHHLFINWFVVYSPYFILGYLIRVTSFDINILYLVVVFIISFTLTSSGCYLLAVSSGVDKGVYFYNYLSITVIPMSISVMLLFKKNTKPILGDNITQKTARLTLGAYLVHPLFLDLLRYFQFDANQFNPGYSIPVISIIVFIVSLMVASVINTIPLLRKTI